MLKVIVGACKKVGVRIVQGWAESHNLHVSLPQQRHTLIRYEVVNFAPVPGLSLYERISIRRCTSCGLTRPS